jgi:hypothetical protein
MTKDDLLKTMLDARKAAQSNKWELAHGLFLQCEDELRRRSKEQHRDAAPTNIRIKAAGLDLFTVYMGGIPRVHNVDKKTAIEAAQKLVANQGGRLMEVPW